ncbi:MAG: hypothetical protein DI538_06660 [Azospira oryzae]|nr:MAG: hypothetical protein DI538_06660 [Azospira oryzae]
MIRFIQLKCILICFISYYECAAQQVAKLKTHHGVYLSVSGGAMQGKINGYTNTGVASISGTGTEFDVQVGGALTPRWILHGIFTGKYLSSPTINNTTFPSTYAVNESVIGLGVTRYTHRNYFLAGNIGTGYFSFSDRRSKSTTDNGLSFFFKAGREWWLTRHLAAGLALTYGRTKLINKTDNGTKEKWNSGRFGVVLQITLN